MEMISVLGGAKLEGDVPIHGSKNAALPILFSSLLFSEPVSIAGLPKITDVSAALSLLGALGVRIGNNRDGTVTLDPRAARPTGLDPRLCSQLRGSVYLLGAAIARFGSITLPRPGGCNFGVRPIDLHLAVFSKMGLTVSDSECGITLSGSPRGTSFHFPIVSVGATVNAILAATLGKGRTVITGAAREPHVSDLIRFLRKGGAKIDVPEPGTVVIDGVRRLHAVEHTVCPDQIEASTYLLFTMATRGKVTLRTAPTGELATLLPIVQAMGAKTGAGVNSLYVAMENRPSPISITCAPYPGFPTDLQPQMTALLAFGKGESVVSDPIFPTRFGYVRELNRMGAGIGVGDGFAVCPGNASLSGRDLSVPDLRAGAALLLAALAAEGESTLPIDLIKRGYADLVPTLRSLGAGIRIRDGGA